MSESSPLQKDRPLSPHLQVYRLPITAITSILHRATGIALMLGLILFTWGLMALAGGEDSYNTFMSFCTSLTGQIMLIGWSGAFFYHLCTGLRHFILDSGCLYEKKAAARSSWAVILIAVLLTAATWAYVYQDVLMGGTAG